MSSVERMSVVREDEAVRWFRRLALLGALLAAGVVVLGAWVRLTHAGLGCPDWPGCYGHLYPQAAPHGARAWHEMVHRYFATTLGLTITALGVWAWVARRRPGQPRLPVALLFVLVCAQGALGALTVTWLLNPYVVTAHLLGGLTTLGLLCWLAIPPERTALMRAEAALKPFALAAFALLVAQIALGGWTSSNYAALACPDFPTCQQAWWPHPDYRGALTLWQRGIDYEGGVLANPARVAIHLTHRLGALVTGVTLAGLSMAVLARSRRPRLRAAAGVVLLAVGVQISLGIALVHFGVPLPVATLHNAGAALLIVSMVTLLRALRPVPAGAVTYQALAAPVVGLSRVDPAR